MKKVDDDRGCISDTDGSRGSRRGHGALLRNLSPFLSGIRGSSTVSVIYIQTRECA